MKTPIADYILIKLSRAAPEDDLIYSVCQRTGFDWDQAKALAEQVKVVLQ
jgi:hypothetical protein